ncbi:unnamed protein product [Sphagnum compactum]
MRPDAGPSEALFCPREMRVATHDPVGSSLKPSGPSLVVGWEREVASPGSQHFRFALLFAQNSIIGGSSGVYVDNGQAVVVGELKCDVLGSAFQQNSIILDEQGGHSIHQDGRARASPLRASHGNSGIPEGAALLILNSFSDVGDVFFSQVVFLDEQNLRWSWERG